MLELKKIERNPATNTFQVNSIVDENYPFDFYWELYEDGVFVKDVEIRNYGENIFAQTRDACRQIAKYKCDEFPTKNLNLSLNNFEVFDCFSISVMITKIFDKEEVNYVSQIREGIIFSLNVNLFKWQYLFGFDAYKDLFLLDVDEKTFDRKDYGIIYGLPFIQLELKSTSSNDLSIEDYVGKYVTQIRDFHQKILGKLNKNSQNDIFFTSFNFPEELKIPCKQYLLYFAQFLQDLGINATSNLKEEAGKILFSVTPTDDIEALDKIWEALAVYLNLPSSPIVYDDSFAAMRLKKEIDSLHYAQSMMENELRSAQYTLRLAQQTVEHQDKIIQQKDSIIEQQNRVIEKVTSKSIMMDSVEKKEEFEKIFDGLEVGESKELKEKLGIKFNPATSLKTLGKKIIGRDDDIISLDLNKED